MNSTKASPAPAPGFQPTRWTVVLRARGETPDAQAALSQLCEAYYAPVLAFLRSAGQPEDAARDLAHDFFARLLAGHAIDSVDPNRGRFRSFLLGAVKHFVADQHDRAHAAKRGSGQAAVSIESGAGSHTSTELQIPDPAGPPPDTSFDREWAQTLVERVINQLTAEFEQSGKAEQFQVLKPWLLGNVDSLSQADAARRLGLSEGAVKVAIHRLRRRFRELVRSEVAQTVGDPGQVNEELKYLVEVLASGAK